MLLVSQVIEAPQCCFLVYFIVFIDLVLLNHFPTLIGNYILA